MVSAQRTWTGKRIQLRRGELRHHGILVCDHPAGAAIRSYARTGRIRSGERGDLFGMADIRQRPICDADRREGLLDGKLWRDLPHERSVVADTGCRWTTLCLS